MKEERLLNIFGEVDDKFIEKSAPENLSEKNDNSLSEQQYPVVVYSENKSEKQKSHSPLIRIIGVALACAAVLGICFGVKLLGGGGLKFDLLNPADTDDIPIRLKDWEELDPYLKYYRLSFNQKEYGPMITVVAEENLGEFLGNEIAWGYKKGVNGVNPSTTDGSRAETTAKVYAIKGISQKCVIAVKFSEDESFYVYYNRSYSPETLGDYIDGINLTENMKIRGTASGVSVENATTVRRKYYGIDSAKVLELLLSNRDCWNVFYYNRAFTAEECENALELAFDIPILGIKNGSLSITKGGLVYLNSLCGNGAYFFVGKDKTDVFVNYVKENCYSEKEDGVINHDTGAFDKNNPETWIDDENNDKVGYEDAKKIKTGMTFEEIVEILGKPQRDVGSGVVAMEWDISTGEVLYVCFNKVPPTDELNLMSYYVEIKKSTA